METVTIDHKVLKALLCVLDKSNKKTDYILVGNGCIAVVTGASCVMVKMSIIDKDVPFLGISGALCRSAVSVRKGVTIDFDKREATVGDIGGKMQEGLFKFDTMLKFFDKRPEDCPEYIALNVELLSKIGKFAKTLGCKDCMIVKQISKALIQCCWKERTDIVGFLCPFIGKYDYDTLTGTIEETFKR